MPSYIGPIYKFQKNTDDANIIIRYNKQPLLDDAVLLSLFNFLAFSFALSGVLPFLRIAFLTLIDSSNANFDNISTGVIGFVAIAVLIPEEE